MERSRRGSTAVVGCVDFYLRLEFINRVKLCRLLSAPKVVWQSVDGCAAISHSRGKKRPVITGRAAERLIMAG